MMLKIRRPTKKLLLMGAMFLTVLGVSSAANGTLMVNQITQVRGAAIADSSYTNGWQWIFDVTVPSNEPLLKLKFANWSNGSGFISAGNNMRYYSPSSVNASSTNSSISIGSGDTYAQPLLFATSSDLDLLTDGIQVKVYVETKIPIGISGNNFTSTYGVKSLAPAVESVADFPTGNINSPSSQSLNAEEDVVALWSRSISISTRDAKLKYLTLRKSGTAADSAFTNFTLYVDNVAVANASSLDVNGDINFDLNTSPIDLAVGSHQMVAKGTVSRTAAGSNARFTLQNDSKIVLEDGLLSGYSVIATTNNGSPANNLQSGLLSLNAGSMHSLNSISNPISDITAGAVNYPIATFRTVVKGDDLNVSNLSFRVNATDMVTEDSSNITLQNVTLYVNGVVIGTPQSIIFGNNFTYNNFSLPLGTSTIELRANMSTAGSVRYTGGSLSTSVIGGSLNAVSANAGNHVSTLSATGQTFAVVNADALLTSDPSNASFSTSSNLTSVRLGKFLLKAGTLEGLSVSGMRVNLTGELANKVANLVVKDENDDVVANVSSAGEINNISYSTSMNINEQKAFTLYIDIMASAVTGDAMSVSISVNATGAVSATPIPLGPVSGPTITIN